MRIDRMLSIVVILLNRRKITAKELAQRFEVSLRTIYRDIESINLSGIPVISNQGTDGGYEIPENYKLSRQYISVSDLRSILAALKGINAALDDTEIELISEKIQCLLPEVAGGSPDSNAEILVFDAMGWGKQEKVPNKIQILYEAIKKNQLIDIRYQDGNGQVSQRQVEPMTLIQKGFSWYLFGFCKTKMDFRVFKLARIKEISKISGSFERKKKSYKDIRTHWVSLEESLKVVLKFQAAIWPRVEEYHEASSIIDRDRDSVYVEAFFPPGEWLLSTLLSYGPHVEVISPDPLRKQIRDVIDQMADTYRKNTSQKN